MAFATRWIVSCTFFVLLFSFPSALAVEYGSVEGTLFNETGETIANAALRLRPSARMERSGDFGHFTFERVVPGRYTLLIQHADYYFTEQEIVVSALRRTRVELVLSARKVKEAADILEALDRTIVLSPGSTQYELYADELARLPRENAMLVQAQQAGVVAYRGLAIRGNGPDATVLQVEGLDADHPFLQTGDYLPGEEYPFISPEMVQVARLAPGVPQAQEEAGLATVADYALKRPGAERPGAYFRYRIDAPFAYGSNGSAELEAAGRRTLDLGVGFPLGQLSASSLFLGLKYATEDAADNGLAVYDRGGNNLGRLDNNRLWQDNIVAHAGLQLAPRTRLSFGAVYGQTARENAEWAWAYADTPGAGGTAEGIAEKRAKQHALNVFSQNYFARLSRQLGEHSWLDLRASFASTELEYGRLADFNGPEAFGGLNIIQPQDSGRLAVEQNAVTMQSGADGFLDHHASVKITGTSEDGILLLALPALNPLTGYYEGPPDVTSTRNPYGLPGLFYKHGSAATALDFRSSQILRLDGLYTLNFALGNTVHTLLTGFDVRHYSFERFYHRQPWLHVATLQDVYGGEWGGDIYGDADSITQGRDGALDQVHGSLFVQNNMRFGNVFLAAGLRWDGVSEKDYIRYDSATAGYVLRRAAARGRLSPRITASYLFGDKLSVSLGYARLFARAFAEAEPVSTIRKEANIAYYVNPRASVRLSAYLSDGGRRRDYTMFPADLAHDIAVPAEWSEHSKGVEIALRYAFGQNMFWMLDYTVAEARGKLLEFAGSPALSGEFALAQEVYRQFDMSLSAGLLENEGPRIGKIYPLELSSLTFMLHYHSGMPYTEIVHNSISALNAKRGPEFHQVDLRFMRSFNLSGLFGDGALPVMLDVYVDIANLLNRTKPMAYWPGSGNADVENGRHDLSPDDFGNEPWYARADMDPRAGRPEQYDAYGRRLYNASIDSNADGVVDKHERYASYLQWRADDIARKLLYQLPRSVQVGFMLRF